jgi:hypothetical protein
MQRKHSIEERRRALRLSKQICEITQMIMQNYGIGEYDAIVDFYHSATYKLLSDYDTKLWWHSVYAIFEVYKAEKETGSVFNSQYVLGKYV